MCCLFGIMNYKHSLSKRQINYILNVLATACESRGTDATGIAYNNNGRLCIYKKPLPASKLHIRVPNGVTNVMGHTRMTTQGTEKLNYNNHPFYGNADSPFALAHNGIISNDNAIRKSEKLPSTHIKTDSYIAVQLIEGKGSLGFDSLRYMAEQLNGSFTITVLDGANNLYIVKGNNPMCLYHYPKMGVYIYASTEEILLSALKKLNLSLGKPDKISIVCGKIMRINSSGKRSIEAFNSDKLLFDYSFYPYHFGTDAIPNYISSKANSWNTDELTYIDELKTVANYFGYTDDYIDFLLSEGYSIDDIEEFLYSI